MMGRITQGIAGFVNYIFEGMCGSLLKSGICRNEVEVLFLLIFVLITLSILETRFKKKSRRN